MTLDQERVQELFNAAKMLPPSDCGAYLEKICGDNDTLRAEVESLLQFTPTSAQTIEPATIAPAPGEVIDHRYESGDRIGNYEIVSELGAGGFGVVYFAQQHEPVRREVALKVLLSKRCTDTFIQGFDAERKTLAKMSHPGIAHFYDSGLTQHNLPFFVMEYVSGQPITEYCDEHRLSIRQRLSLFADVCKAVQHAHNKGVIHRDLTPNNILVSKDEDGKPRAQIIDFGIARKTDEETADVMGTLVYMSPEQATRNESVDARSDIYTLGVVLYELLIGQPPFDSELLKDEALQAQLKMIQEQDPPSPSTKLSGILDDETASIAAARQVKLDSLLKLLRRELDWIPRKALQKDPDRRYTTASAFGSDVLRYLQGEAIEAAPDSTAYRMKKLFKRNKGKFIATATILFVLVGGITFSLYFAFDAVAEREIANEEKTRAEAVKDFVTTMLSSVDPATAGSMDKELMMLVLSKAAESVGEQFEDQPLVEAEIRSVIGNTYRALGKYDEAESHLVDALAIDRRVLGDEHPHTLWLINDMAGILMRQGKYDESMPYFVEALETQRRILGDEHYDTLNSIGNMGNILQNQGKYDEAMPYSVESLETRRRVLGDEHPATLWSIASMGHILQNQGKYDEAMPYFVESLETRRRVLGDEHPDTLWSITNMAGILMRQGKYDESMPYSVESLETRRRILGDEHPDTLGSIGNMGNTLMNQGKFDEAMPYFVEALETRRRVLGDEHPDTLNSIGDMGALLASQGKYYEAMPYFVESLETRRRVLGNEHPGTLWSIANMGHFLMSQGKYDEAMPYFVEALETRRRVQGDEHPDTLDSIGNMGDLLSIQGKYDEALVYYLEALETRRRVQGDEHPDTLDSIGNMGDLLSIQGKYDEALVYYLEALETQRRVLGNEHPGTLWSIGNMGDLLSIQGKYDEALVYYLEALETQRRVLGNEHPDTLYTINTLIELYDAWDKPEEAQKYRDMLPEEDTPKDDSE